MEPAISPMSSPATSKTFKPHICSTKTVDPAIKRQASSLATSKVDLSVKQLASSRSSLRRPLTSRHHSFLRRHRSVTWIRFCEQLLPSFFLLGQTTLRHPWSIEFESKSYSNCHTAHLYRRHSRSREIASSSASHPCEIQLYHKHFRSRHHAQDAAQPLCLWQHRLARNSPPRLRCTESKCGLLTSRFVQSGHLRRLLAQDPCAGSSRPVEWPRRCD